MSGVRKWKHWRFSDNKRTLCGVVPPASRGGKYRVVQVFSIGEGPDWYYRVSPIVGRATLWGEHSDRLHVIPGECDYTEGWLLIRRATPWTWEFPGPFRRYLEAA